MSKIPDELNFAPGVTVNILMQGNNVFTGELIDAEGNFLLVRLTVDTPPFTAGQVVRLNIDRIIAIG